MIGSGRRLGRRAKWLTGSILLCVLACGQSPQGVQPLQLDPADLNILFIGNSLTYTNDLPGMVLAMLDSAGVGPAVVANSAYPNFGLQDHWSATVTRRLLSASGWDYVIFQQGPSATEGRPSLLEYGQLIADAARESGAQPAFFMVWPSNARFFDFDGVSESYRMAADSANALLFPAGEAWRVAWEADSTLALYGPDDFHPSVSGTYLAALVMFEQISGRNADEAPRILDTKDAGRITIPADVAPILQAAATEANNRFARTVNAAR